LGFLDLLSGTLTKVVGRPGVKVVVVASIFDFLPQRPAAGSLQSLPGIPLVWFMDSLKDMPADLLPIRVDPANPCLMMYTGGTTGSPKGAVLTHDNVVHHMVQLKTWVGVTMGEHAALSAFPMFHQAGNFLGMWSMAMGSSQVLIPHPRDLHFIVSAIKKNRPTSIVNVPTIYLELLKLPEFRSLDFSGVQWFTSGASPFSAENIREFEEIVGKGKLEEVYGMSETTRSSLPLPTRGSKKWDRLAFPFATPR